MLETLVLVIEPRLVYEADRLSIAKIPGAKGFSAGSTNQISLQSLKTIVLIMRITSTTTTESNLTKQTTLNPDSQATRISNLTFYRFGFERDVQSSNSQLPPKLKFNSFDRNQHEWPEWSNMFVATAINRVIPNTEKFIHLKLLLIGKAKAAIASVGYRGELYAEAWASREPRIGRF